MRVLWTPEARQDRADVWDYIAADNPRAAARMDQRFSDAAARLAEHPMLGRAGKIPGTRELIPHESYRLVYEIDGETVWIRPGSGHRCAIKQVARMQRSGIRGFGVAIIPDSALLHPATLAQGEPLRRSTVPLA